MSVVHSMFALYTLLFAYYGYTGTHSPCLATTFQGHITIPVLQSYILAVANVVRHTHIAPAQFTLTSPNSNPRARWVQIWSKSYDSDTDTDDSATMKHATDVLTLVRELALQWKQRAASMARIRTIMDGSRKCRMSRKSASPRSRSLTTTESQSWPKLRTGGLQEAAQ